MHYRRNYQDVNFGNLVLRTMIDIKKLQMVNLKDVLLNIHASYVILDSDALENEKVSVFYQNASNMISIVITGQNRAISKSTHLGYLFA